MSKPDRSRADVESKPIADDASDQTRKDFETVTCRQHAEHVAAGTSERLRVTRAQEKLVTAYGKCDQ